MRKVIAAIGLEVYAVLLAWLQSLGGVRTDEAKYLLNIPYPHPPVVRTLLSLTSGFAFQEMLWRVVFATLTVQAVWLVWHMGKGLRDIPRLCLAGAFLAASAVVLQAGSVMLAVPTALFGLLFFWLLTERLSQRYAFWVAVLWLLAVFTAYQAVLFFPVAYLLFRRMRLPLWEQAVYLAGPVAVLALYTLSNPLALATMAIHVGDPVPLGVRASETLALFFQSGSGVLAFTGLAGAMAGRRREILVVLALLLFYVVLSPFAFYAILFLPPLIVGSVEFLRWLKASLAPAVLAGVLIGTAVILYGHPLSVTPTPARETVRILVDLHLSQGETLLIAGAFGHEWQYESPWSIRRFSPSLLPEAKAVVCLSSCSEMVKKPGWHRMDGGRVEVWIRNNDA